MKALKILAAITLSAAVAASSVVPALAGEGRGAIIKEDIVFAPHDVAYDLRTDAFYYTDEFF